MPESTNSIVAKKDMSKEFLLGALASNTFLAFMGDYLSSLPRYIDDAERDFGLDIYERMLRDPVLGSSIRSLKVAVLSKGPRFLARVKAPSKWSKDPEKLTKYEKAEEIRLFIERMCDRLQEPLENILFEMLDCLVYGHAVAEETYEVRGGQLILKTLRVKPRENYSFVVDRYMNLEGLVGTSIYQPAMQLGSLSNVSKEDVIPREKFFILTWDGHSGDPRGSSLLRGAYNAWYLKQQTWPQYLKFLVQFGTPSIAAFLPEESGDVEVIDSEGNVKTDSEGNPVVLSAEEAMLEKLIAFANGTAIVLPHGSEIELIQSQGDGGAYVKAFDLYDRQMTRAILIAARATMEAEHGSKADSSTAQDILADFTQYIQRQVEAAFMRDVIMPVVRYNFGDDAADGVLCPYMALSEVAREDVIGYGNMIANLARSEMIHTSQLPGIDAALNLPERDFDAQVAEMEAERELARDRQQMFDLKFPTEA